jgi:hypothetical protein
MCINKCYIFLFVISYHIFTFLIKQVNVYVYVYLIDMGCNNQDILPLKVLLAESIHLKVIFGKLVVSFTPC